MDHQRFIRLSLIDSHSNLNFSRSGTAPKQVANTNSEFYIFSLLFEREPAVDSFGHDCRCSQETHLIYTTHGSRCTSTEKQAAAAAPGRRVAGGGTLAKYLTPNTNPSPLFLEISPSETPLRAVLPPIHLPLVRLVPHRARQGCVSLSLSHLISGTVLHDSQRTYVPSSLSMPLSQLLGPKSS